MVRDIGLAEELAQDALVVALEQWPRSGIPDKPGAWLMATARHRAIDHIRHARLLERKHQQLGHELEQDFHEDVDDPIGDDLLRLMFVACHPILPSESRVA